jgi:hypothetical protein
VRILYYTFIHVFLISVVSAKVSVNFLKVATPAGGSDEISDAPRVPHAPARRMEPDF